MRVLLTGCAGYIGSVLTGELLRKGYSVIGLDNLMYGGESLLGYVDHPRFQFVFGDIRDRELIRNVLDEVNAIIHLAAIVGDPACRMSPKLAEEVNWIASRFLFDESNRRKNIRRFIFASTCSNYGRMKDEDTVNEDSPLRPISHYARLKVQMELHLLQSRIREDFVPTSLRFSTVYGLSPRPRFDLTVNEFTREVVLGRTLEIYGEQFWRPYCHVRDIARACCLVLEAPPEKVRQNVFGVGDSRENYQKKMLADMLLKIRPEADIRFVHKDEDPRDYKVDFTRIQQALGFSITRTVFDGMKEIAQAIESRIISNPDDPRYSNI